MFTHEFNVYETLEKLDGLLEAGHADPSPMDRAEYQVLTNKLVQGAVELLEHLALHDVLALETAESLETIAPRQIAAAATDVDGAYSDEIVAIQLPAHLVPYGAIVEAMKSWNVGTVETTADLAVLARLWSRYLEADPESEAEHVVFTEWARRAERVSARALPAVQQLDAAGLLYIRDSRTGTSYRLEVATVPERDVRIELSLETKPDPVVAATRRGRPGPGNRREP